MLLVWLVEKKQKKIQLNVPVILIWKKNNCKVEIGLGLLSTTMSVLFNNYKLSNNFEFFDFCYACKMQIAMHIHV